MLKGIYDDMPENDYHALKDYLSASMISKLCNQTPAEFYYWLHAGDPPTKEMVFGSAFHSYVLAPETSKDKIVIRKSVPVAIRDEFAATGIAAITVDDFDTIRHMTDSLNASEYASSIINHGDAVFEESCFMFDEPLDTALKGRTDIRIPSLKIISDLKSSRSGAYYSFQKTAVNYGYDIQATMYLHLVRAVTGEYYKDFIFIVVEKTPPFMVSLFRPDQLMLDEARVKIKKTVEAYHGHMKSGVWPGYPDEIQDLHLPAWAQKLTDNL